MRADTSHEEPCRGGAGKTQEQSEQFSVYTSARDWFENIYFAFGLSRENESTQIIDPLLRRIPFTENGRKDLLCELMESIVCRNGDKIYVERYRKIANASLKELQEMRYKFKHDD